MKFGISSLYREVGIPWATQHWANFAETDFVFLGPPCRKTFDQKKNDDSFEREILIRKKISEKKMVVTSNVGDYKGIPPKKAETIQV